MDVDCLTPEKFFPKMLDCRKTMMEVGFVASSLVFRGATKPL